MDAVKVHLTAPEIDIGGVGLITQPQTGCPGLNYLSAVHHETVVVLRAVSFPVSDTEGILDGKGRPIIYRQNGVRAVGAVADPEIVGRDRRTLTQHVVRRVAIDTHAETVADNVEVETFEPPDHGTIVPASHPQGIHITVDRQIIGGNRIGDTQGETDRAAGHVHRNLAVQLTHLGLVPAVIERAAGNIHTPGPAKVQTAAPEERTTRHFPIAGADQIAPGEGVATGRGGDLGVVCDTAGVDLDRAALKCEACFRSDIHGSVEGTRTALPTDRAASAANPNGCRRRIGCRVGVQRAAVEGDAARDRDGRRFGTEHAAVGDQHGFDIDRQTHEAEITGIPHREFLAGAVDTASGRRGRSGPGAHIEAVNTADRCVTRQLDTAEGSVPRRVVRLAAVLRIVHDRASAIRTVALDHERLMLRDLGARRTVVTGFCVLADVVEVELRARTDRHLAAVRAAVSAKGINTRIEAQHHFTRRDGPVLRLEIRAVQGEQAVPRLGNGTDAAESARSDKREV